MKNEAKQKIEKHKKYLTRGDELKKKIAQSHQQLVQFFPNLKKECDLSPELFDYYFDIDLSSCPIILKSDEEVEKLDEQFLQKDILLILGRFKLAIDLLKEEKVATAEEALLTAYQQHDLNEDDK